MDGWLQALEASALAQTVRFDRWAYAAVNGAHILGIALLVGAILPLDLRLLGAWRGVDRRALARVLVPTAAAGLTLAVAAGATLFATRASDYAGLAVFQAKLALIVIGAGAALLLHRRYGLTLDHAPPARLKAAAALSLCCWLTALACGRLIAFVGG